MTHGRKVCNTLKEIRRQIADRNDIAYLTTECHFEGECQGTCPKCEAELKYLENELHKRRLAGKVATVAGISFGLASTFYACNAPQPQQTDIPIPEQEIAVDTVNLDTIPADSMINATKKTHNKAHFLLGGSEEWIIMNELTGIVALTGLVDVERTVEFPGGEIESLKFIKECLKYPQKAKRKGIEGTVLVTFTVGKDGKLSDIEVIEDNTGSYGCAEEAVRVVQAMPKWIPDTQNGRLISDSFVLPITFKLEKEKTKESKRSKRKKSLNR